MSFPTLQVRPNEKNPMILRAHEFLRQSNQLLERNLINNDGKKMLARMLTKMVAEAKAIYALDEKRTDAQKSVKLQEQLKNAHQTSVSVLEDRFVNADLARQVFEKKLDVQKKTSEIEHLRKSVQEKKLEIQREAEKNEAKVNSMRKANEEMAMRSAAILKHLETSDDVSKLRKMEEEKRKLEKVVEVLRDQEQALTDQIKTNKATLKAESKKPFKNVVIDCARQYKLCQSLTPKLQKSQRNVERLKKEEEACRANGSLDETIQFDRSFVLASMERDTLGNVPTPPPSARVISSQKLAEPSLSAERIIQIAPKSPIPVPPSPMTPTPVPSTPRATVHDNDVEMTETAAPPSLNLSMETQRVQREITPEVVVEETEQEKDMSVDVMEQEEREEQEEPMEQETEAQPQPPVQIFSKILTDDKSKSSISASPVASATPSSSILKVDEPKKAQNKKAKDQEALLHDVAARLEEAEEVLSDNGSNREDNFSFNFFGRNGGENGNSNESEANFDFNFGVNASGDESNSGGAGAFDFLGVGSENNAAGGSSDADPFGFGKSSGGNGGDMSFNFNFDAGNGENEEGRGDGGNSNGGGFFNF